MNTIPYLAIIPAKATSERCPGKNTRLLGGYPLFLHSVHYALQEGFTPIVSTDSEAIISLCRKKNILHFREIVYERNMAFCVRQILHAHTCRYFAVLQPTSPFRQPGLLKTMLHDAETHGFSSCYTSQKIKIIGHLDGEFQHACRTQDATRFLHFFDGNINLSTQTGFFARDSFFDDDSRIYDNPFPCCLQIDTENEFAALDQLAAHPAFRRYLPRPAAELRLCLIANKTDLKRDYSDFIDSCDIVMRINKMDNLASGLAGSKTDIALISCCTEYLNHTRKKRNADLLTSIPILYFNDEEPERTPGFAFSEKLEHGNLIPPDISLCTPAFTTLSKGLLLADYLYPGAIIHFLGDSNMAKRTPGSRKHHPGPENAFMQTMIATGRVVPILEDDATIFRYSRPAAAPATPRHAEPRALPPAEHRTPETIRLWHPEWSDDFRIIGNRGARLEQKDAALILQHDDAALHLQWDRWGKERFIPGQGGWYHWVCPNAENRTTPKHGSIRKVGFMRVLNEEHTIAACMLSVAPVLDDLLILWADMDDRSIERAEQWKPVLENEYGCRCHFLHYPHHIVPPHSVSDLCAVPEKNRIDTYYNFGMDHLQQTLGTASFAVVKVDADQIYLPEHLGKAFAQIRTPMDCISIGGHNTAVHHGRFALYKPHPRNGVDDALICGAGNLPRYGITPYFEKDTTPHPTLKTMRQPCWLHFMKTAKYGSITRPFHDDELIPVADSPEILRTYATRIRPLLLRTQSTYADLSIE